jgi:hypothetical protein
MVKPYRIIFKPGAYLPSVESLDPTFTDHDCVEMYFELFFTDGYIDRCKIWKAQRQFEAEQRRVPAFPGKSTTAYRRKILQRLSRRSLAFRLAHLERICA